ncbi:MAG: hypothetical protein ACOY9D_04945 [Pseudomonadota bacterium]
MPNFTDISGLAGVASAGAAALLLLPGIARLSKPRLAVLQGTMFVLLLIPFGELPLAAYLRGATGDLSITTLVLLGCALSRTGIACGGNDATSRRALLTLAALVALPLYPLSLGLTAFDPYRLGYGDPLFVTALLLAALAVWIRKQHLISSCISLAVLAWTTGWYESGNLWDYLLDPWVAIYALSVTALHGIMKLLRFEKTHEPR